MYRIYSKEGATTVSKEVTLRAAQPWHSFAHGPARLVMFNFICNICSNPNVVELESTLERDSPNCLICGSNVRFRWTIHMLSTILFGNSLPLKDFPSKKEIRGIGLSDEPLYADALAPKFNYLNTFYHRDPHFDIKDVACGEDSSLDFIIATEVFEHIPPPIQPAFDNLYRLIKPDGFIIFSTPWRPQGHTNEHFPNLFDWVLTQIQKQWLLVNKTKNGEYEIFDKLIFHGGQGQTLEMRLFSRPSLEGHFAHARLQAEFAEESCHKYGILFNKPWSLPCILRRLPQTEHVGVSESGREPGIEQVSPVEALRLSRLEIVELYREIDAKTAHTQRLAVRNLELEKNAQVLSQQVNYLQQQQSLIKQSKWLRLGRLLGLGPKLL